MERIDDDRRPWVFESTITDPTGLKVHVTVTAPPTADWDNSLECAELAQMGAATTVRHIRKNRKADQERCPF